jgi:hypothetical protein
MSTPFFERNSFVLRQLLHPGWVKYKYLSVTTSMVDSPEKKRAVKPAPAQRANILPEAASHITCPDNHEIVGGFLCMNPSSTARFDNSQSASLSSYPSEGETLEQFKKPPTKKQPEPDSLDQQKQEDPDQIKPQNEEPEKHQTGHQL